jgi:hypothetical protein
MMSVRRLLLGALSLFALLGLPWVGSPDTDTDTVATSRVGGGAALCEQAASHLRQCCAGLDAPPIVCTYRREHHVAGCSGSGTSLRVLEPALDVDESRRIVETTCAELETQGACARGHEASK